MEKFVKIDVILKNLFKRYGISENLGILYDVWEKVVGKEIAKKIKLCGARKDELLVTVNSPACAHHLKLNKNEYLKKINELLSKTSECEFKKIKIIK
ncbi:MAG: DUF721 domain-containing protein [Endomicrobiia bacterium]